MVKGSGVAWVGQGWVGVGGVESIGGSAPKFG